MLLVLSTNEPWEATYYTQEGQSVYRVESPSRFWTNRKAIIYRAYADLPTEYCCEEECTMIARIDFHTFKSSKITLGNVTRKTSEIFRKQNRGCNGSDRIFQGPDGREYRWMLGSGKSKLYLNDMAKSKTLVARYHNDYLGTAKQGEPHQLEIYPSGEHLMDLIVVTFIYIEHLRVSREENSETFI